MCYISIIVFIMCNNNTRTGPVVVNSFCQVLVKKANQEMQQHTPIIDHAKVMNNVRRFVCGLNY